MGQNINIGQLSKIVNFHPIDLKFEEDLRIWSLNSTTNYFLGQICFMDFASLHDVLFLFVCLLVCGISQKVVDGFG